MTTDLYRHVGVGAVLPNGINTLRAAVRRLTGRNTDRRRSPVAGVGPLDLVASWGSVAASKPGPDSNPPGARSHARTNELGVLYTAVAGMLNLLAIIDSSYRAAKAGEEK